ncbi:MAG TPA: major capsid protein P2 [Rhodocyclaceae bacterium]|nr:major capsid protein P2 [Rhodocyclaceae bacterium]
MSVGKLIRNGNSFANVVATGWATATITPGRTVEGIMLELGGTSFTKAMITTVRLKADGKVYYEASGTQIDKRNAYLGHTADAAFLPILFTEHFGRERQDQMVGAFDTSKGIKGLTVEVQITGATAPTLTLQTIESASQWDAGKEYAGLMHKTLRYPWSRSVGGDQLVDLPFGTQNGALIKRIFVEHTGNVTGITMKQNAMPIYEGTKVELEYMQKLHGKVPQTNFLAVDYAQDGNLANILNARDPQPLELRLSMSAADSGYVVVEYLDVLGNL